jgi:hypothetical protein
MYPNSSFLDILPGNRIYVYTGPVTLRYGTHKGYYHFQGSIDTVGTGDTRFCFAEKPINQFPPLPIELTPRNTASVRWDIGIMPHSVAANSQN